MKRTRQLYREEGLSGLIGGGHRYLFWNIPQYRNLLYWIRRLFRRNYVAGTLDGDIIKLYYNKEAYLKYHNILDSEMVSNENVPLSVLKSTNPLDAVVDVGSHFGIYSVLLKTLNPKAELYSFEPDGQNAAVLKNQFKQNGISGHISQSVVSDYSGTTTFYIDPEAGSQSHSTTFDEKLEAVKVPTVALSDFFIEKNVKSVFIKIDAEGEEFAILKDLVEADLDYAEGVVELHPEKIDVTQDEVISFLESEYDEWEFITETSPNHKYGRPMYYFKLVK